jgi:hypothetical protein
MNIDGQSRPQNIVNYRLEFSRCFGNVKLGTIFLPQIASRRRMYSTVTFINTAHTQTPAILSNNSPNGLLLMGYNTRGYFRKHRSLPSKDFRHKRLANLMYFFSLGIKATVQLLHTSLPPPPTKGKNSLSLSPITCTKSKHVAKNRQFEQISFLDGTTVLCGLLPP